MRGTVAVLLWWLLSVSAAAQSRDYAPLDTLHPPPALTALVTIDVRDVPLRDALQEVARQSRVSIVFEPTLPGIDRPVTIRASQVASARVIARAVASVPVEVMVSSAGSVVVTAKRRAGREWSVVSGVMRSTVPLSGVHLMFRDTRFESTSNDSGSFSFGRVPAGTYRLSASRIGFEPLERTIVVDGHDQSIDLAMTAIAIPLAAVIVTPGYFGIMQSGIGSSQTLTRAQIETVPQLGEDAYRALGRLPGVASQDFSAKFAVRGEPADELLVTLDGLPLVEPFHLKDMGDALSIVDLASLRGVELITGGPPAEYGDQLAGVFRLHTLAPRVDRARTSLGVSLTNVRGMSQGGFAGGRGAWLVSGRRGYLDLAFKIAHLADSLYPRYNDLFGKVTYALPRGDLAVHVLRAADALRYQDSREPRLDSKHFSDYVWGTYTGDLGSWRTEAVAWYGSLDRRRSGDGVDLNQEFTGVRVTDSRSFGTFGLKNDWSIPLGDRALFKFGADLRHERAEYAYTRRIERRIIADHGFLTRIDTVADNLAPSGDVTAVYAAQRVRPIESLTLEAGLRYDRASATDDAALGPRLNVAWQPNDNSAFRISWGDYSQRQAIYDLQVQDGVQTFSHAEHAKQIVAGSEHTLPRGLTARIEAYSRRLSGIRPRYINATTNITAFPELGYDRVLLAPTDGRSQGVELSLAQPAGSHIDWTASYVRSSAMQVVNGIRTPRPNDQPHAVHVDWSAHSTSNKWRFTTSAIWHTGWPYTPDAIRIDTVVVTPNNTTFAHASWTSGQVYSRRLPSYQRLDARWTRFFDTHSGRVSVFVDVYNVFNRTNVRDVRTNVSINRLAVSYGDEARELLPRIPSFGVNWEF